MVWLISGPSSAGKSTFLQSKACERLTGIAPRDADIVFPFTWENKRPLSHNTLFHYNIMRTCSLTHPPQSDAAALKVNPFDSDNAFRDLTTVGVNCITAILLVCDRQTLLDRASRRQFVEQYLIPGTAPVAYNQDYWTRLYHLVDLGSIYAQWREMLKQHSIPYIMVDSTKPDFPMLHDALADTLPNAISQPHPAHPIRDWANTPAPAAAISA